MLIAEGVKGRRDHYGLEQPGGDWKGVSKPGL